MNISPPTQVTTKRMIAIGAVLVLSTFFTSFFNTPTQALSLDSLNVGNTVSAVTAPLKNAAVGLPVIDTLTPLLMNTNMPAPRTIQTTIIPATPVSPPVTVQTTTNPATSPNTVTPAPVMTDMSSTNGSVENTPVTNNNATTSQPSTPTRTSTGLTAIMKQAELLEAPAHIPGGALMYSSHQISAQTANILFLLGATGVVVGGCIIFATRQRMGISS